MADKNRTVAPTEAIEADMPEPKFRVKNLLNQQISLLLKTKLGESHRHVHANLPPRGTMLLSLSEISNHIESLEMSGRVQITPVGDK